MESAFGVNHGEVSKGLPSALKSAKALTPGSYGAARKTAHLEGRAAGKQTALMRTKKPGWTTHQFEAGMAHRTGSFARADSRQLIKKPR